MNLCDIWSNVSETVHDTTSSTISMKDIHEVIMIFQSTFDL